MRFGRASGGAMRGDVDPVPRGDHVLSVDVEDWPQSTFDPSLEVSERVRTNTQRLLDLFDAAGARATFFCLGIVARRFPGLLRDIVARGHEVASHGSAHAPVFSLGPAAFRTDLRRSIAAIEDAAGARVIGYRAPDFSIAFESFWAFEILAEEGLVYDSSIFPFRGPRYGVGESFSRAYAIRCRANERLLEFPLATITLFGRRIPVAGGGYFRLMPYALTRAALRSLPADAAPACCYFHPYELDAQEFMRLPFRVPARLRLSQGFGRRWVPARLQRLLHDFRWSAARDFTGEVAVFGDRVLDLRDLPHGPPRWEATPRA
jgi:polysaccharide deacetylase family protein (PEP-CTERM system associated)